MTSSRNCFGAFALCLSLCTHGQESFRDILVCEPAQANGYFIVDNAKRQVLKIATIKVETIAVHFTSSGIPEKRTLQSFTIANGFYGKADPGVLSTLATGERAYYTLQAFDANGGVVIDHESIPLGWNGGADAICSETCVSSTYAWKLQAYNQYWEGWNVIDLQNAADGTSPYYFYVPEGGVTGWNWWVQHMAPSSFGLALQWSQYVMPPVPLQTDVIHLTTSLGGSPAGALDFQGYSIPEGTPAYAIRKDAGPWRELHATTDHFFLSDFCDGLEEIYNTDHQVQQAIALHQGMDPLTCTALPSLDGVGEWDGGDVLGPDCGQDNYWDDAADDGDDQTYDDNGAGEDPSLIDWALSVTDCFESDAGDAAGSDDEGLGDISGIQLARWDADQKQQILAVNIPDKKDPKLVPVPKTVIAPGLYEFVIILKNGSILRHFEDTQQSRVIQADFAAFTHINVYPVPVKDCFSIDFDLPMPMMNIGMTVVNNAGNPYYTKSLDFELSGRNKHVVKMDYQWPAGIYHAIFQYADGSSESVSFNVQ